jgi:hypothetical protein
MKNFLYSFSSINFSASPRSSPSRSIPSVNMRTARSFKSSIVTPGRTISTQAS